MIMKRRILSLVLTVVLLMAVFTPVGASAASKIKILKVTVSGARIRKGPSSAYDVATSVKKGSKVFYLNKMKNSFAYVSSSTGTKGWMYKGYLSSYGSCYKSQIYYSKKSRTPVYKKANTHSKKVTKLSRHQYVILYEVKGGWAYIKTLGGTGGFVKTSSLKKA